jgi:hypothetical protein
VAKRERRSEKAERLLAAFDPQRFPLEMVEAGARRWRRTFAQQVFDETGARTHLGFDWHAFSYGFVHALSGEEARAEYGRCKVRGGFAVFVGETMDDAFSCASETLPWLDRAGLDAYIVPADFAWTMVFTHEADWCGPYFTTADWARERGPLSRGTDAR